MEFKEAKHFTVQQAINLLEENISNDIKLWSVARTTGYSPCHFSRLFSKVSGITMREYVRKRKLSHAAIKIRDTNQRLLDIAIEHGFDSQEAFSRAFLDVFGISPGNYRKELPPLPLEMPMDCTHDFYHNQQNQQHSNSELKEITIQFNTKPARKLIYMHDPKVRDYHGFCEYYGEVWGILLSLKGTLGEPIDGILPPLRAGLERRYYWGVEVPLDYQGAVPAGMEIIDLPEIEYAMFSHPPYPEIIHELVHAKVNEELENWEPDKYGFVLASDSVPEFGGDDLINGCFRCIPVSRVKYK